MSTYADDTTMELGIARRQNRRKAEWMKTMTTRELDTGMGCNSINNVQLDMDFITFVHIS
jgi:hypothetical protein